ncbi:hypothetical protein H5410_019564 [Solanum commersonii]|uniref:Uncharacterized protein n=1 Tax=Solanum commersonii TaxID=4109 RepID=A0A9J5Z5L1_SOLCO|nr:hypothetical protein H5410_019564 [Solanum commersonii]
MLRWIWGHTSDKIRNKATWDKRRHTNALVRRNERLTIVNVSIGIGRLKSRGKKMKVDLPIIMYYGPREP